MKNVNCVELKNRVQEEILRDYAARPKDTWARHQAEVLTKSPQPIAELWRRIQTPSRRDPPRVAEAQAEYPAQKGPAK